MKNYKNISAFIAGISHKKIISMGKLIGLLAYILDRRHRSIVIRNLCFANPAFSRKKVRSLAIDIFKNFGITALEICQMAFFQKNDLIKRVEIIGKKYLTDTMNSSRSVIIYSAHIGNWEMGVSFISYYFGLPVLLVARRINSKFFNNLIYKARARSGNIIVDKKNALRPMAETLKKGGIIALMIDQSTKISRGVNVLFYDKTATSTPAASVLARRFNSIVLPIFCIRKRKGGFILIIKPPVIMNKIDDLQASVQETTQIVEDIVKKYPEQWFWFHKRWKRHYPHLYKEDIKKRKQRKNKEKKNNYVL